MAFEKSCPLACTNSQPQGETVDAAAIQCAVIGRIAP